MRDEDIAAIAGVAPEDIYGADIPDYAFPWLFNPRMNTPAAAAQFRWTNRAQLRPEKWSLDFIVRDAHSGEILGTIDARAEDFATTREIATGSWVFHRFQGLGVGTLIRHAVVSFGLDYLGAQAMSTSWVAHNEASARVSQKLGYQVVFEGEEKAGPQNSSQRHVTARVATPQLQAPG
nr:GNAT family protein [Parvimonas sp. C2]